jgi:hypothetical protein
VDENLTNFSMFYLIHKSISEADVLKNRVPMLPDDKRKYNPKNGDGNSLHESILSIYWERQSNDK